MSDSPTKEKQLYVMVKGKRYRRCMPMWGSCRLKESHKGPHDANARGGKRVRTNRKCPVCHPEQKKTEEPERSEDLQTTG